MTDIVERLRDAALETPGDDTYAGLYEAAADEIERLRAIPPQSVLRALANAIEDIQWMSAASDFQPDGKAHKGWIKVRVRLERYETALAAALEKLPETRI